MSLRQALRQPALPPAGPLPRALDAALSLGLALLGFFVPVSVAGVSVLLGVLMLIALLAAPAVWRSAPWREPTTALGLVLFVYIASHTVVATGLTPATLHTINRYHELLLAVVLFSLFRLCTRKDIFLWGLLAGTLVYAAAHWAAFLSPALAAYLGPRRIGAGFVLAVTGFLLVVWADRTPRPWALRSAGIFLGVTVLFAIQGRTGHLVVLLLVACTAWLYSPARWRWFAAVAGPVLVLVLAMGSSAVHERVRETMAGSTPDAQGELSSTGIRIELVRNGLKLAGDYGLTGGGFAEYLRLSGESAHALYAQDPERRGFLQRHWVRTMHPHNEYLMQLVGGGVAALALFVAWLWAPLLRSAQSPPARAALVGVVLAFGFGCLFNSLLLDFVEGHFYMAVLAWLLARSAEASATPPAVPA